MQTLNMLHLLRRPAMSCRRFCWARQPMCHLSASSVVRLTSTSSYSSYSTPSQPPLTQETGSNWTDESSLKSLARKELQALAKIHSIKANLSSAAIIDAVLAKQRNSNISNSGSGKRLDDASASTSTSTADVVVLPSKPTTTSSSSSSSSSSGNSNKHPLPLKQPVVSKPSNFLEYDNSKDNYIDSSDSEEGEIETKKTFLGYDIDYLASLNDSAVSLSHKSSKFKAEQSPLSPQSTSNPATGSPPDPTDDPANRLAGQRFDDRVKGFLELNPYSCPGCGSPFQSKRPESPGFLEKEKLKVHFEQAKVLKEKQDAIGILRRAGIDPNSAVAEDILRKSGIADDIIRGVRQFGASANMESERQAALAGGALISPLKDGRKNYLRKMIEPAPLVVDNNNNNSSSNSNILKSPVDRNSVINSVIESVATGDSTSIKTSHSHSHSHSHTQPPQTYSTSTSIATATASAATPDDDAEYAIHNSDIETNVCQRCFRLKKYGQVEESLRPGWSDHELLTPKRFETLLSEIKETRAVVVCLLDLFDLQGSMLSNLNEIVGHNPIVVAVNKIDLIPKDASQERLRKWIFSEVKEVCKLRSPKDIEEENQERYRKIVEMKEKGETSSRRSPSYIPRVQETGIIRLENIHFVSCQTGYGIGTLVSKIMSLAKLNGKKIYVMGAANVGKSSFINRMLESNSKVEKGSIRPEIQQVAHKNLAHATVSSLPGTTLNFLRLSLPDDVVMIDTPGLINQGQLTSKLTFDELKKVVPIKPVNAVTFRIEEGKCVMIGGLASVELLEGRPLFFTFFIGNEIKLHPTSVARKEHLIETQMGKILNPPESLERWKQLGPFEDLDFDIEGKSSWKESSNDIVIAGLGWVSITGPGHAKVRVSVPKGTSVRLRSPLLPFEAPSTTAKFSGGRIIKKAKKTGHNKVKTYGWRA